MPDDPATPAPIPGTTPTGYKRTQGGGVKWQPPTAEHLSILLPQYDIECILGYGGMGAVYKGKQKALDRTVAIKILPPGLEDEDFSYVDRFKNEAKVMAKFMHPAIVGVFDFGETSEGQLYIVMEFVDGTDVQKMLSEQGRLPSEHALAITAHVCDALKYAHEHGVIHRDIKPANILINMEGAVKVADFGLAKAEEAGASGLTKSGMAMGTPDFVAPETLVMGVNVDGRADLYAVGVMLYNMLTGNVPRGAFKPASVQVPGTDPRFDVIVQKAMQMDREERYQSAMEIRRDLDVILTTPLMQAGGKSSAAIPKQALKSGNAGLRPAPGGPQARAPRKDAARTAAPNLKSEIADRKSKAPLLIGIAAVAAIAIGAFFMSSRKADVSSASQAGLNPATQADSKSALPIKVRENPKVGQAAGLPVTATGPVAPPSAPPSSSPASLKAVSPTPPGVSATALQNAAAKPAPAISNLKSSLPNADPTAFPPGQWVKVFTKLEDLPSGMGRPGSGVKFEDGWLTSPKRLNLPSLRDGNQVNVAVRMKLRGSAKDEMNYLCNVVLRYDDLDTGYVYVFRQAADRMFIARAGLPTQKQPIKPKDELFPVQMFHSVSDQPWTIEFGVVGSWLIARRDGLLLPIETDATIRSGRGSGSIMTPNAIRDIEVINLDGIPEAEALRILGVDEKGNDLRAAALAAEKLAIEQKQVAQAAASIPELATLDEQLKNLTAERVSAPFKAEVAKLNSGYLGGLDRKMAEEKAAGHLDSVLAIEAEKKLITDQQPIPSAEDDATSTTTPAVLKGLRQIYRDAYAKIEATRAASLKALTDPLTTRLKLLESDLTKKDRIADAKTVKEYREGLAESDAGIPARNQTSGGAAAKMTETDKNVRNTLTAALNDGFTNSLGMKFVPVKGTDVLFCIHETRYKDYAAFAADGQGVDGAWKDQSADGFTPTDRPEDHPVTKVSWMDAQKFCEWISKKEGKTYRLPTDQEWSVAVGIGRDEKWKQDTTPATVFRSQTDFPWGDKWPPPKGSGNLSDQSRKEKAPTGEAQYLDGYDDGYPTTAPVMSFKPNKLGLYDLSGNVGEWCESWYDTDNKNRVLRGGSCYYRLDDGTLRNSLLSSARNRIAPGSRYQDNGFRVVVETRSPSPDTTKPGATTTPPAPATAATAAKSDFSNSLGMKFVKVPGTQVLFCIHETRRQDYAAYAAEVPGADGGWKNQPREGILCGH